MNPDRPTHVAALAGAVLVATAIGASAATVTTATEYAGLYGGTTYRQMSLDGFDSSLGTLNEATMNITFTTTPIGYGSGTASTFLDYGGTQFFSTSLDVLSSYVNTASFTVNLIGDGWATASDFLSAFVIDYYLNVPLSNAEASLAISLTYDYTPAGEIQSAVSPVPLPASLPLMLSAFGGVGALGAARRRKRRS